MSGPDSELASKLARRNIIMDSLDEGAEHPFLLKNSNGLNFNNDVQNCSVTCHTIGFISSAGKYLTAETFGFKINGSGISFRKKQLWYLEIETESEGVYFRSHLGKYLLSNKYGSVSCEEDEKTPECRFVLESQEDGRFAVRHSVYGFYFSGHGDDLKCQKGITDSSLWTLQYAIHPMVNLKSVKRQAFAHLEDDVMNCNEQIPWGSDALLLFEYHDGLYAFKTFDNRYLHREGTLSSQLNDDSLFYLEIRSGTTPGIAFRDKKGLYMTAYGPRGQLRFTKRSVGQDELYALQPSAPQLSLTAGVNSRRVSIRQGLDVSANQRDDEISDSEIFQLEYDPASDTVCFRCSNNVLWSVDGPGVQCRSRERTKSTQFKLQWREDGGVYIRASNGKYLSPKMTGHLMASSSSAGDAEIFWPNLENRPLLVLKSDFGYLGFKSSSSLAKIECNRTSYDIFFVTSAVNHPGCYYLQAPNGKSVAVSGGDQSLVAGSSAQTPFVLELRCGTKMAIRPLGHQFVRAEQNGHTTATGNEITRDTLFDY